MTLPPLTRRHWNIHDAALRWADKNAFAGVVVLTLALPFFFIATFAPAFAALYIASFYTDSSLVKIYFFITGAGNGVSFAVAFMCSRVVDGNPAHDETDDTPVNLSGFAITNGAGAVAAVVYWIVRALPCPPTSFPGC